MAIPTISKPQPTLQIPGFAPGADRKAPMLHSRPQSDFDPFANAKVASPFYMYNHDSPRQSYDYKSNDYKSGADIVISVKDLESGLNGTPITPNTATTITPTVTSEKRPFRNNSDSGIIRVYTGRAKGRCMTKPRISRWQLLPHWQRLMIKLICAAIIVGLIIGLAVGLSIHLHGGIWKNSNQTAPIGS